jgi:N-acetylglucosaminyl-diphospho-decaprenol L-rhamnosyltransferase
MALVDIVVVSYNSARHLRLCVEPLAPIDWAEVIVVDNASSDTSIASVADLPLRVIKSPENQGFAAGCNLGWSAGDSPYVLFLNPDSQIDATSLRRLVAILDARRSVGIAAPRIVDDDGALMYSLRRFPRVRSTFAQALGLYHLTPAASWADEAIRRKEAYERAGAQEWVSGACMLVRRSALAQVGGWDEGFFLYCEDIDLCRRVKAVGLQVWYEPRAVVTHAGGRSAPRSTTLPLLAQSRVRYARLHRSRAAALAERVGIALEAAARVVGTREGRGARSGHIRSLRVALSRNGDPCALARRVTTVEGG